MQRKKITVIGSGALGTSLANVLKDSNDKNEILIYGIDEKELDDLKNGKNSKYFPEINFHCFDVSNNSDYSKRYTKAYRAADKDLGYNKLK